MAVPGAGDRRGILHRAARTGQGTEEAALGNTGSETAAIASMDYLILVNKNHPIPDGWENVIDGVSVTNSLGDESWLSARHTRPI